MSFLVCVTIKYILRENTWQSFAVLVHLLWFGIRSDNTAISFCRKDIMTSCYSLFIQYLANLAFTQTRARVAAKLKTSTFTQNTVKPVKLVTLVNRPPVTVGNIIPERSHFYDILHGHYIITWPPPYLESWPLFQT